MQVTGLRLNEGVKISEATAPFQNQPCAQPCQAEVAKAILSDESQV